MDSRANILNINKFQRMFLHLFGNSIKLFNLYAEKQLKQVVLHKEENEKFTTLDWVLQKHMELYLAKNFGKLKIIGEEHTNTTHKEIEEESIFAEFLKEPTSELSEDVFSKLDKNYTSDENEIDIEECATYIDPIDSTSSLIKYRFDPVTSLVGVTYKGQAHFGLVFFPKYRGKDEPTVFFNIPKKGLFKYTYNDEKLEKIDKVSRDYFHFAITETRENEKQRQIISLFENNQTERLSGLGNKVVESIVNGYFYLAPSGGLGFWDICACHALAREVGGNCFYSDGEEVRYPQVLDDVTVKKTCVISPEEEKLRIFLQRIAENNITI